MQPENKGNLVIRRAFAKRDGVDLHRVNILARVTHKKMSMAYQMTEEVGEFGSGRKSPLYLLCELINAIEEIEQKEGSEYSAALEMAEYPILFLRQLRGDVSIDTDAIGKMNLLLKVISDANYQLKGRCLQDLTLGELKEFSQRMMSAATLASEIGMLTEAQIDAREQSYSGAPVQGERLKAVNSAR